MSDPVLAFRSVWKSYALASRAELHALHDVTFAAQAGETISITGRSGSGKSTLLHLAAGIDRPSRGSVSLLGHDLAALSDRERTLARRHHVGLVFQFFHLLPHLDVLDNVALPARIAGVPHARFVARALQLLERVGLADRWRENVQKLSGGEMQRIAICRALLLAPKLLLADEPTGNLDDENGAIVMYLLLALAREQGSTLLFVTHSHELAALADRTLRLTSGRLAS